MIATRPDPRPNIYPAEIPSSASRRRSIQRPTSAVAKILVRYFRHPVLRMLFLCLPPPFDGNLLQIMPWPTLKHLNEEDLRAIYEYVSAVPCIEGPPAPSVLHNDCQ